MPHSTPSVRGMQLAFIHTAWPICVADFSARVIGRMAPVGHTSEHLVHSGRQYPRSYDISGCISFVRSVDGRSTPLGHTDTQSWQAVQCCVKCCSPMAPGGTMACLRRGVFFSSMMARPPSTFFSCAFMAAVVASRAVVARKLLRALSICVSVTCRRSAGCACFSVCFLDWTCA